ncbi:sirohydrochlorin chelatase [Schlesneria paludicola]|uniref:sirohydrochlorin chelatase n=1 Tax=Schlesneria paludicola TaxID=360056 RepID=UPI000299E4E6|nr:CbiX/SirB N-terminal domain-containing protein [Schlesneria paludicola]
MRIPTGTLLVARDVGAAWGRQHVEELAQGLESRLHQPVAACLPDIDEIPLLERIQSLVEPTTRRLVIVPCGLLPVPERGFIARSITAAQRKWPSLTVHVAVPLTWIEWSGWLRLISLDAIHELAVPPADTGVLVVGQIDSDPMVNANLARLAHLIYESSPLATVTYAFLGGGQPGVSDAIRTLARQGLRNLIVIPWLVSDNVSLAKLQAELAQVTKTCNLPAQLVQPTLAHPALVNLLVANCYAALTYGGEDQLIDTTAKPNSDDQPSEGSSTSDQLAEDAFELQELEARINALLPSEYQGRYEDVSSQSMGTAGLKYDTDGNVAWDEIWTSFCDLALAGGPPHRGRLLEAVSAEDVKKEPEQYQAVVTEIGRGIQMVTGLPIVASASLGWIGVRCENEEMAVWLMRAIIVENIMVRREGNVLYLPAGPQFTVKREIKNVITAVAKTVHYWTAHLNARRQS